MRCTSVQVCPPSLDSIFLHRKAATSMSEKIHRVRVPGAKLPSRTISLPIGRAMNGRTRWRTGPIHVDRQASISSSKKRSEAPYSYRSAGPCPDRGRAIHTSITARPSSTQPKCHSALKRTRLAVRANIDHVDIPRTNELAEQVHPCGHGWVGTVRAQGVEHRIRVHLHPPRRGRGAVPRVLDSPIMPKERAVGKSQSLRITCCACGEAAPASTAVERDL